MKCSERGEELRDTSFGEDVTLVAYHSPPGHNHDDNCRNKNGRSVIVGEGFGSSHSWERPNEIQVEFCGIYPVGGPTVYRCTNCGIVFEHFYHRIENIFDAMKLQGIPEYCAGGTSVKNTTGSEQRIRFLSKEIPDNNEKVIIKTNNGSLLLVECLYCDKTKQNPLGIIFWNDPWQSIEKEESIIWWHR